MTTTAPAAPSQVLGRNIKAEMARKGISQDALAKRLGKSQAAVSKRLRGEISPTVDEAVLIADHLGVELVRLFEGVGA